MLKGWGGFGVLSLYISVHISTFLSISTSLDIFESTTYEPTYYLEYVTTFHPQGRYSKISLIPCNPVSLINYHGSWIGCFFFPSTPLNILLGNVESTRNEAKARLIKFKSITNTRQYKFKLRHLYSNINSYRNVVCFRYHVVLTLYR